MTAKAETMAKAEYVIEPGKQEITITRNFDAPRELVFKAYTDPKLVPQWFGPREYTTTVDKMDARPGGCGASSSATRTETSSHFMGSTTISSPRSGSLRHSSSRVCLAT